MSIEIRELVIKATIAPENSSNTGSAATGADNSVSRNEAIINACVEKILEIIKEKHGR